MKAKVVELIRGGNDEPILNAALSLRPFIKDIEARAAQDSNDVKTVYFKYLLESIHRMPDFEDVIDVHKINNYTEILQYIYLTLLPPISDEKQSLWALGLPLSPVIFYGTDTLYNFLLDSNGNIRGIISNNLDDGKDNHRLSIIYSLALERLYGFSIPTYSEITQIIPEETTKLKKAYHIQFDTRFIDVSFKGEKLPEINPADIHTYDKMIDADSLQKLQAVLPIKDLRFEGFDIVSITDITTTQAIENIKNIIVNLTPGQMNYDDVIESLKNLIGIPSVYLRITPMLKVNNKLVINSFEKLNLKLREICSQYGIGEQAYIDAIENFSKNPSQVLIPDLEKNNPQEDKIYSIFSCIGIKSMAIVPIYFQKNLVGALEIFSKEKNAIDEKVIVSLEPVIPLLEQLLQTNIDDFDVILDNIVKDKFTSLQPSVQWRFNEAAWHYLQKKRTNNKEDIATILFQNVYPLYGAIDIRNSTLERNIALQTDLQTQLNLLIGLLGKLSTIHHLGLIDEMNFKAKQFLQHITEQLTNDEEYRINQFFEEEIVSFLIHFQQTYPQSQKLISDYYLAINRTGIAFENQTALEQSLQTLNTAIVNLLDQMNIEIQNAYPCFFEKFRSDGVEYDIYIGQSITPNKEFHPMYLKNLRLWQLTSMALIAKLTQALLPQLPKQLQTTQLIFIHTNPIDISFRNDERHFDVEGAYNIRYEVVKKRIDKVHIKNSEERLTQPNKIALVYFQQKDIEDYLSYITYLQEQHILNNDLEFLDLEELQGISGLKALRIGVNMESESEVTQTIDEVFSKS
ncbi:MAG TPA: GAF domain-containing protein [Arachidicoccus sp.]